LTIDEARETALAMKAGGVGYYPRENFIHLDVGPVRSWSQMTPGHGAPFNGWPALSVKRLLRRGRSLDAREAALDERAAAAARRETCSRVLHRSGYRGNGCLYARQPSRIFTASSQQQTVSKSGEHRRRARPPQSPAPREYAGHQVKVAKRFKATRGDLRIPPNSRGILTWSNETRPATPSAGRRCPARRNPRQRAAWRICSSVLLVSLREPVHAEEATPKTVLIVEDNG
jgi:hypothetical protein